MSYWQVQASFSLNFPSLFSVMRDNSSIFFLVETLDDLTKGARHSGKFQTFDCSCAISPNLYFDRLLMLKEYKISAKKVQRSYVS